MMAIVSGSTCGRYLKVEVLQTAYTSALTFPKQHQWIEDIWFSFHPEPLGSLLGWLPGRILVFSALQYASICTVTLFFCFVWGFLPF